MTNQTNKDSSVILKDVHCPYCNTDHALLLSRVTAKRIALQVPAFGLRVILSMLYLPIIYIFIHGYKLIEAGKETDSITYGFCPNCGNGYSMAPPEMVKEETKAPKLYKVQEGKAVMGLCRGISEYTDIPLLWVRILTVLYGFTVIGAVLYFLIGACIPFREDAANGTADKRLYRSYRGRDIMGLCKGFSNYTGIPVMWVRIFTVLFGLTVLGTILYFIVAAFVPVQEHVEQGIQKKKLYKIRKGKVLLGLCTGFAEYSGMQLWLVRLLVCLIPALLLVLYFLMIRIIILPALPLGLYCILGAIVPTKEDEDAEK